MSRSGSNNSGLEFENYILDNVHGYIGLTPAENRLERHPAIKRLQGISQLGLVNWIFPSALHNRYVHSLGVMHVADLMAKSIGLSVASRTLIRMAGLLHDIGHYPLSHDCEFAYKEQARLESLVSKELIRSGDFSKLFIDKALCDIEELGGHSPELFMEKSDNMFHHERIGQSLILSDKAIMETIEEEGGKYGWDVNDVCAIIVGDITHCSQSNNKDLALLIQMMHSEIDADRIDYLLRDAEFTGASYGKIDLDTLLQTLAAVPDPYAKSGSDDKILSINQKGIGFADQFLVNRYLAYNQVIFHKHTSILGCLTQSLIRWMIEDSAASDRFPDPDTLQKMVCDRNHNFGSKHFKFVDQKFLDAIAAPPKNCPNRIKRLMENLEQHEIPKKLDKNELCISCNLEQAKTLIEESPIYTRMKNGKSNLPDSYFQFRKLSLTPHLPNEKYKNLIKKYYDADGRVDEDGEKIPFDELEKNLLRQRLQHGIAVKQPDESVVLLVDEPRSILGTIYNLTYIVLREYQI